MVSCTLLLVILPFVSFAKTVTVLVPAFKWRTVMLHGETAGVAP